MDIHSFLAVFVIAKTGGVLIRGTQRQFFGKYLFGRRFEI